MKKMLAATLMTALAVSALWSAPAFALDPYDTPVISCVSAGENKLTIKICGGASGAPAGVTIHWMKYEDFVANGGQWLDSDDPGLCKLSLSGQPSLQHPGKSRWELTSGECEEITIGDINFDETGVSGQNCGVDPLECGTEYVFRSFAHAGRRMGRSDWSTEVVCATSPCPAEECTFTQGYWKTHGPVGCQTGNNTNQWPATSLMLGTVNYTDAQLCSILNKPAQGNGLIALAHQLIAAKLNFISGATCPAVAAYISQADALIGGLVVPPAGSGFLSPSSTSSLIGSLDNYNNGVLAGCPAHCDGSGPAANAAKLSRMTESSKGSWGNMKIKYR